MLHFDVINDVEASAKTQESNFTGKIENNEQDSVIFPPEIWQEIILFLLGQEVADFVIESSKNLTTEQEKQIRKKAFESIRNLTRVNKNFYNILADPNFTETMINKMKMIKGMRIFFLPRKNDDVDNIACATLLRNSGALSYLNQKQLKNCQVGEKMGQYLITNNNDQEILFLLKLGADSYLYDPLGSTPLCFAIGNNNLSLVHLLLKKGADVNRANNHGVTALYSAAIYHKNIVITECLLKHLWEHSKKMEEARKLGLLRSAAFWGIDSSIFDLLLQYGFDVNEEGYDDGKTPLHYATYHENCSFIEYLLRHGAAINKQDHSGDTPLHLALRSRYKPTIEALLQYNPDLFIKNNSGQSPMGLAIAYEHDDIASLLKTAYKKN